MSATSDVQETTIVDLSALLDAGKGAVVILVAGETLLAAHRAVLAARSPVFRAMFNHNTLEASSGQVSIADVEGPVLRQLLAYMYTLQAPQLPGMAPQLLAAADKYGLSALKAVCEQQVVEQLSVENAAASAVLAVRHSCPNLTKATVAFIKANLHVMGTQGWADMMRNNLEHVIEVSRMLADPSPKASAPAATGRRPAPVAQGHAHRSRTAAAAAQATAPRHTSVPDDPVVSRMRSLSAAERGRRLIHTAKWGTVEELQCLLAAGANIWAADADRRTALHWAAERGQLEVMNCLLEAAAEVGTRERMVERSFALFSGASGGMSPNPGHSATDRYMRTPLHYAAENGHTEVAAALLEVGAERGRRDSWGRTPLDLARQNQHQHVIDILSQR